MTDQDRPLSTGHFLSTSKLIYPYILGPVRALSPALWSLKHLTALYLNDNNLTRLPPEVSNLKKK